MVIHKLSKLDWLDHLTLLDEKLKENKDLTQAQLAQILRKGQSYISSLYTLRICFDQEARDKIRAASQAPRPCILSYSSAKELAILKGRVPDLNAAIHQALDQFFEKGLGRQQIIVLVEWLVAGKPLSDFKTPMWTKGVKRKLKKRAMPPAPGPDAATLRPTGPGGIAPTSGRGQSLTPNITEPKPKQSLLERLAGKLEGWARGK